MPRWVAIVMMETALGHYLKNYSLTKVPPHQCSQANILITRIGTSIYRILFADVLKWLTKKDTKFLACKCLVGQRYISLYMINVSPPVIIHMYSNIKRACLDCKGIQELLMLEQKSAQILQAYPNIERIILEKHPILAQGSLGKMVSLFG